jgi:hypothetical protein
MGKLTAQLQETMRDGEEMRSVADEDDGMKTLVKPHIRVAASEYGGTSSLRSDFIGRFNHQNSSH